MQILTFHFIYFSEQYTEHFGINILDGLFIAYTVVWYANFFYELNASWIQYGLYFRLIEEPELPGELF